MKGENEGIERNYKKIKLQEEKISSSTSIERISSDRGKLIPSDIGIIVNDFLVNNFEEASKLLSALGCKKRYRVEKLREVWKIKGCKNIYIDAFPGLPWYLEIGCDSEKKLFSYCRYKRNMGIS